MTGKATPSERAMRARAAAFQLHAMRDSRETTAAARAASPAALRYFLNLVDPDLVLPQRERSRRAESARKAYFTRLALASARARRNRARPAPTTGTGAGSLGPPA